MAYTNDYCSDNEGDGMQRTERSKINTHTHIQPSQPDMDRGEFTRTSTGTQSERRQIVNIKNCPIVSCKETIFVRTRGLQHLQTQVPILRQPTDPNMNN